MCVVRSWGTEREIAYKRDENTTKPKSLCKESYLYHVLKEVILLGKPKVGGGNFSELKWISQGVLIFQSKYEYLLGLFLI